MNIKTLKPAIIFLLLVFIGILGYLFLKDIDFQILLQNSSLSKSVVLLILIAFVISEIIVIGYNKLLLTSLGNKVSTFKLAVILWVSQTSNYLTMAKVGLPVRIVMLKKLLHVPYTVSISTKLIVSWLMLITVAVAGVIGSVFSPNLTGMMKTNIFTGGLVILGISLLMPIFGSRLKIKKMVKGGFFKKVFNYFIDIYTSLKEVPIKSNIITFSGIVFRSIVIAYVSYLIINAISEKPVNLLTVWAIQAVNSIVSLLSFVPMGLGTKDLSLVYLFSLVGVGKEEAIVLAAYERLIWMVLPFILGFISAMIMGVSTKNYSMLKVNREHS